MLRKKKLKAHHKPFFIYVLLIWMSKSNKYIYKIG